MITGTAIRMIITIIRIMMSAELGLLPCRRLDRGALRLGVAAQTEKAKGRTRPICGLQRERTEPVAYELLA
jgi:hypothetical protein